MQQEPQSREVRLGTIKEVARGGRGRHSLIIISFIGMCHPQRVRFLSPFGPKTGIDFAHYGLKSGKVFRGTTSAYYRESFESN